MQYKIFYENSVANKIGAIDMDYFELTNRSFNFNSFNSTVNVLPTKLFDALLSDPTLQIGLRQESDLENGYASGVIMYYNASLKLIKNMKNTEGENVNNFNITLIVLNKQGYCPDEELSWDDSITVVSEDEYRKLKACNFVTNDNTHN